jgi:hypothetical protein
MLEAEFESDRRQKDALEGEEARRGLLTCSMSSAWVFVIILQLRTAPQLSLNLQVAAAERAQPAGEVGNGV